MRKDIAIYSPAIAKDLILRGYRVINIAPARYNSEASVFFFNNIPEIREILKEHWDIDIRG